MLERIGDALDRVVSEVLDGEASGHAGGMRSGSEGSLGKSREMADAEVPQRPSNSPGGMAAGFGKDQVPVVRDGAGVNRKDIENLMRAGDEVARLFRARASTKRVLAALAARDAWAARVRSQLGAAEKSRDVGAATESHPAPPLSPEVLRCRRCCGRFPAAEMIEADLCDQCGEELKLSSELTGREPQP